MYLAEAKLINPLRPTRLVVAGILAGSDPASGCRRPYGTAVTGTRAWRMS
ncbi:MAG: hypothetical protein ACRD2W_06165 [Acidimicrobiales bacterium]